MNQLIDQSQQILTTTQTKPKIRIVQDITINVNIKTESTVSMQIKTDPTTPFNEFIQQINATVFQNREQDYNEDFITYHLDDKEEIRSTDTSSIKDLGFYDGCLFHVKLKLKGG